MSKCREERGSTLTAGYVSLQVCEVAYFDSLVCYIELGL
jgi:hypothetical protein